MSLILDSLSTNINLSFREKRPGIYKILAPFFYEDGDMYDIFIQKQPSVEGLLRISDFGLTLMKLLYTFREC
jgi:hypothetical protein